MPEFSRFKWNGLLGQGHDLDLIGVEAESFREKFFDRFRVEVGDFSFDRYFMNEGSGLILLFVRRLSRKKRDASHRLPITVGMRAEAAAAGRWDSLALER